RSHLPLFGPELSSSLLATRPVDWAVRDARVPSIKIRTTQHQACDYLEPRRGILLADQQRLGKTLTAILAHDPARGPLVVVGPLPSRGVLLGWLRRVYPETPIAALTGRKIDGSELKKPIIFVHYDVVHKWQALMKIGTLVLDEAHALTNKDARRSKACGVL